MQSFRAESLPTLAIVIPCFNEGEVITDTVDKIYNTLNSLIQKNVISTGSFIYLVDDGSSDDTWENILSLQK